MINQLTHTKEFQALLQTYAPSAAAKAILAESKLLLLLGPTSSGRNTIIDTLVRTNQFQYIVSDTTRQPRINNGILEQNGIEYWFKNEEEVLAGVQRGDYIEAEVIHAQQVSGIRAAELKRACAGDRIAVTDIDVGGMQKIAELKPDTWQVLVLPPSFKIWQERLARRGTMDATDFRHRLETAKKIFEFALSKKDTLTIIINQDVTQAAMEIEALCYGDYDDPEQSQHRQLLMHLLQETTALLTNPS